MLTFCLSSFHHFIPHLPTLSNSPYPSSAFTDSTFTDSHCHLDFNELYGQLDSILASCQQRNIQRIIVPSIGPQNWQQVLALPSLVKSQANNLSNSQVTIYPCLGIHPWFLDKLPENAIEQLDQLLAQNNTQHHTQHGTKIIALGEAGIDGMIAKNSANPEQHLKQQVTIFEQQLALAKKHQLPIIVHHRRSHPEVIRSLKAVTFSQGGIIHAFSGSYQEAKQYLDLGFLIGIGGTITYPRATKTINTVKKLPIESLVLETDAPSMPLAGFQGQPNHPKHIVDVFQALVNLRSEDKTRLSQQIETNINRLFGLS